MKDVLIQRSKSELMVLVTYDCYFDEEPNGLYFWFPNMNEEQFFEWWINQESVYEYCCSSQHWAGELILADTEELVSYHENIASRSFEILMGTGDDDTNLLDPRKGLVYHKGYCGAVHGTPYLIHQKEELFAWYEHETDDLREWFDENVVRRIYANENNS